MKHPAQMTPEQRDAYRQSFAGSIAQRRDMANGLVLFVKPMIDGQVVAMGFAGKAIKPAWHYRFRNDARMEAHAAEWAAGIQRSDEAKAARKAQAAAPHTLQVGDVLHSQWGYEQTNNDYFQVTALVGKRMVEIRQIGNDYRETGFLSGKSKPKPGHFIGEPMRKVVNGHNRVRIESFATAGKCDPNRETYESHYA